MSSTVALKKLVGVIYLRLPLQFLLLSDSIIRLQLYV